MAAAGRQGRIEAHTRANREEPTRDLLSYVTDPNVGFPMRPGMLEELHDLLAIGNENPHEHKAGKSERHRPANVRHRVDSLKVSKNQDCSIVSK
jgi:hypothetical protein